MQIASSQVAIDSILMLKNDIHFQGHKPRLIYTFLRLIKIFYLRKNYSLLFLSTLPFAYQLEPSGGFLYPIFLSATLLLFQKHFLCTFVRVKLLPICGCEKLRQVEFFPLPLNLLIVLSLSIILLILNSLFKLLSVAENTLEGLSH